MRRVVDKATRREDGLFLNVRVQFRVDQFQERLTYYRNEAKDIGQEAR